MERAVEVRDASEGVPLERFAEEDLVRRTAVPRGVRSVAVVPEEDVGAEAVELGDAGDEPEAGEDGLLEGAEDPFDPAVGPRARWAGEDVTGSVSREEVFDGGRAKDGAAVGEEALWCTVLLDDGSEDAGDLGARRPGEPLEGDEAGAVVVDDAEDPDGEEAEDEDEGEIGAPELERAADVDPLGPLPLRLLQRRDEVAAAEKDATEGLAGGVEAEDASGEVAELAGAEEGLLDVEPDDLELDVVRSAVPGATAPARLRCGRQPVALRPAAIEATKGSAPPPQVAWQPCRWSSTRSARRSRSWMTARQSRSWTRSWKRMSRRKTRVGVGEVEYRW